VTQAAVMSLTVGNGLGRQSMGCTAPPGRVIVVWNWPMAIRTPWQ